MPVKDTGIVTIYDLEDEGKSVVCYLVDAKEFLTHDRWSESPEGKKKEVKGVKAPRKR